MDGTTAGNAGTLPPVAQPTPRPQVDLSQVSPIPVAPPTVPVTSQPSVPTIQVPAQPQFSQVTPIYAPSPTNTVADIPQPAVKGIEFVQAPAVVPTPSVSPGVPMPPVITTPPVPQANIAVSPVTPNQLMQPVLPQTPQPAPQSDPTLLTVADMSTPADYARIEKQIDDVDIDQMVGNVPVPSATPQQPQPAVAVAVPAVAMPPVVPTVAPSVTTAPVNSYFQTGSGSIVSDVPITEPRSPFGGNNSRLIRLILIIAGIVVVLGVGGYFVVNAIVGGNQQPQATPISEPEPSQPPVPAEPDPIVEEPIQETPEPVVPVVETPEDEPLELGSGQTTETAAPTPIVTPQPSEPDTTPTVANTGIE